MAASTEAKKVYHHQQQQQQQQQQRRELVFDKRVPLSRRFPPLLVEDPTTQQVDNPLFLQSSSSSQTAADGKRLITRGQYAQIANPKYPQCNIPTRCLFLPGLLLRLAPRISHLTKRQWWFEDYELMQIKADYLQYWYEIRILGEYSLQEVHAANVTKQVLPHVLFGLRGAGNRLPLLPLQTHQQLALTLNYLTLVALQYWLVRNEWIYIYKGAAVSHAPFLFVLYPSMLEPDWNARHTHVSPETGNLNEAWTDCWNEAKKHGSNFSEFLFRVLMTYLPLPVVKTTTSVAAGETKRQEVDERRKWCQSLHSHKFFTSRHFTEYQIPDVDLRTFLQEPGLHSTAQNERFECNDRYLRLGIAENQLPCDKEMPRFWTHLHWNPLEPVPNNFQSFRFQSMCPLSLHENGSSDEEAEDWLLQSPRVLYCTYMGIEQDRPPWEQQRHGHYQQQQQQQQPHLEFPTRVYPLPPSRLEKRKRHYSPEYVTPTDLERLLQQTGVCVLRLGKHEMKWMAEHADQYSRWLGETERGELIEQAPIMDMLPSLSQTGSGSGNATFRPVSKLTIYETDAAHFVLRVLSAAPQHTVNLFQLYDSLFTIGRYEESIILTVLDYWWRREGVEDAKRFDKPVLRAFLEQWLRDYYALRKQRIQTFHDMKWNTEIVDRILDVFGARWNGLDGLDKAREVMLEHVLTPKHLPGLLKPYHIEYSHNDGQNWSQLDGHPVRLIEFSLLVQRRFAKTPDRRPITLSTEFFNECKVMRFGSASTASPMPVLQIEDFLIMLETRLFQDVIRPYFDYIDMICPVRGPRFEDGSLWKKPHYVTHSMHLEQFWKLGQQVAALVRQPTVQDQLLDGSLGAGFRPEFLQGVLFLIQDQLQLKPTMIPESRQKQLLDAVAVALANLAKYHPQLRQYQQQQQQVSLSTSVPIALAPIVTTTNPRKRKNP